MINFLKRTLNNPNNIFIICILSLFLLFAAAFLYSGNDDQKEIFLKKTENYLADYFNAAYYASDGNVYFNNKGTFSEKVFLPLSYIIFYNLSKTADYLNLGPFRAGHTTIGLTTSNLFILFLMIVLCIQLYDLKTGAKYVRFLTVLSLMCSGVFIFSYERGNLIFLSVILTVFFIVNYKNENKILRELALISLAAAAALKIYPGVLAALLLYEKRYKETVRFAAYFLFLAFAPFFMFKTGAVETFLRWYEAFKLNVEKYAAMQVDIGYGYFSYFFKEPFSKTAALIMKTVAYTAVLTGAVFSYFQKSEWKKICFLICSFMIIRNGSGLYCGLYLFPVIILFLNANSKFTVENAVYLLLFILILNPFQLIIGAQNCTRIAVNAAVTLLFLTVTADSAISFFQNRKQLEAAEKIS